MPESLPEFDLYAELGVAPGASPGEVEAAWRARIPEAHPDRSGVGSEREATDRAARLNIARDWLTDPARRQIYDRLRLTSPSVDLPAIDPLGPWPGRLPGRRSGLTATAVGTLAVVGLAVLVIIGTLWIGVGSSYATVIAFSLAALVLAFFALLGLLTLLAGRRRR
ncbi:MAG TPA: DnaJ domain-containing protein [Candidatus Limnocylindrales bacterium]|nr:DnaJ domain-containing protein [Candidatus Limnocylindrales bacterium]